MYLVECVINNRIESREGIVSFPDTTEDAITITALIRALAELNKPCKFKIYTSDRNIFYAMETGRAQQFRKQGYVNAKGIPVKNAELWEILFDLLKKHEWKISQEDHSYRLYMDSELKKAHKSAMGTAKSECQSQ